MHPRTTLAIAFHLLIASAAHAQSNADVLSMRYSAGSIQTVEVAERALAEIGREREAVEATFRTEDGKCYSKFFTTRCQEQSREQRRHALAQLRRIEIEAHTLQRRARAIERDKELAEKQQEAEATARQREQALAGNVAAFEKKQREAEIRVRERDAKTAAP